MARSSSSPLGNVFLGLVLAFIGWYFWARFLAVQHTIGFDPGQLGAPTSGQQCVDATLPDITLPGSVSIPGGTQKVCLG